MPLPKSINKKLERINEWESEEQLIWAYERVGWRKLIPDFPYVHYDPKRRSWIITHFRADASKFTCSSCHNQPTNQIFLDFRECANFLACCARCRVVLGNIPTDELENLGSHRATAQEVLDTIKITGQAMPLGFETWKTDSFMKILDKGG